jgi:hypothetical protein
VALERGHVQTVRVHRNAEHAGARALEGDERADEGGRLDAAGVAGREHRARDEVERLARARGDDDLVRRAREALRRAEDRELAAQRGEALHVAVAERCAALLGEDAIGDRTQLVGGERGRVGEGGGERHDVALHRQAHHVLEHPLAPRGRVRRKRRDLPVGVRRALGDGRERPHEGAAAHGGGDVAAFCEPPVDPGRGQVVDPGLARELARGGQLLAGYEHAVVDRAYEALDELTGQRLTLEGG